MSQDTKTTGVKRRDFLKVLGASGAALDRGRVLRADRQAHSISRLARRDGARRFDLLRHDVPRVLGRRAASSPRRATVARSSSREIRIIR